MCRMKILFPLENAANFQNPYVSSLYNLIQKQNDDIEIVDSLSDFWNDNVFSYNVVHIMWPEYVLNGKTAQEFYSQLLKIKEKGTKIVVTCHNFVPHYCNDQDRILSYEYAYELADQIYHLGSYSLELFKEKYPKAENLILYHPVYPDLYKNIPTREESLKRLKLSKDKKYVLCFGQIRSTEERKVIKYCSKKMKENNVVFIVPSFIPNEFIHYSNLLKKMIKFILIRVYFIYNKFFYSNINMTCSVRVSDEELPYYFKACDVALISRMKILNSGNLPLNYYFGNIVVGPNVGNVGCILKNTNNFVFNVNDRDSIVKELLKAFETKDIIGEKNKLLACTEWTDEKIANVQANYYRKLF